MDVNGTRFQLLLDRTIGAEPPGGTAGHVHDWLPISARGKPLNGCMSAGSQVAHPDATALAVTLSARAARPAVTAIGETRRSADRFGNWYWISNDQQRIFWQPFGSNRP